MPEVPRRTLLRAAGVLGGGGLTGAALGAVQGPATRAAAGSSRPTAADWRALAAAIDGDVVRRGDDGYARWRLLANTRFDEVRPAALVRVTGPADVAEAISFARRFALPFRTRGGGHSYVGTSTVEDGLVVDTRAMRTIRYDDATGVAVVDAGATTYRLHDRLARHGRTVPTGTCPGVGLTGLALGGGLGTDSTAHGLTCDSLAGLTIVTADGQVREVDATHEVDLWWASRGGGGGGFGVVTSLRLHTITAEPMGLFTVGWRWRDAAAVVRGWADRVRDMPRSTWCNLLLSVGPEGAEVRVLGRCAAGDQRSEARALHRAVGREPVDVSTSREPFLAGVRALGGGGTRTVRAASVAGSDVVPRMTQALSETLPRVVERRRRSGTVSQLILDPLTGAVQDQAVEASAFPWRRQLAELQWIVRLPDQPSRRQVRSARAWVEEAHRAVGSRSVGAYVNRLEPGRPLADYFGPNLPRLRRTKAAVDPDGFFGPLTQR